MKSAMNDRKGWNWKESVRLRTVKDLPGKIITP